MNIVLLFKKFRHLIATDKSSIYHPHEKLFALFRLVYHIVWIGATASPPTHNTYVDDDSEKTNDNTSFHYFGFYDSGFSDYVVQMHIIYQRLNEAKMKTQVNLKLTENVLFNMILHGCVISEYE